MVKFKLCLKDEAFQLFFGVESECFQFGRISKSTYNFVIKELKAEPTISEITRERLIRATKKLTKS